MKSILVSIYQTTGFNQNYYYPLSLHYLKAYAKKELGDDVDISIENYNTVEASNHIIHDLLRRNPDVIAFSCYIWNIKKILGITHLLKGLNPALKIVLGGPQVTSTPDSILTENQSVDVIVRGEGEQTFAELLKHYVKDEPAIEEVRGISYRVDGEIRTNPPRPLIADLDDIPSPFDAAAYSESHDILIETQRGCPFECGFCSYHKNFKSVRCFSLERVKRDLKHLIDSGVKRLYLADPTFNLNPKRAKEILKYICSINKTASINTELRAELLDQETIDLLEQAGVGFLEIGLQSTNPATLKIIGRETNFAKFEQGIALLRKSPINYVIQLIIGLPGDSLSTFKTSMDYVLNLAPDKLQVFELQLLPGSALHDNAGEHGMLFHPTPPHIVVQNSTFSYTDMIRAKELFREAFLIYVRRNYAELAKLPGLKPSELIEAWSAWREATTGISLDEYERCNSAKRLRLFSRFIKEYLARNGSPARADSSKANCNLLTARIAYQGFRSSVRHALAGGWNGIIGKLTRSRSRGGYLDPIEDHPDH
ncbi:B12-binding domain-containing radical SAM protein [Geomesophilobacter sediminis]|uniref:B12-binding domain-containing radical SAM protein n=1 Tax=Geomesophilobacter sediminis TaxID=2798584 RepID=A0A8J7M241_9BACT|nr:radical SAM protein [Geomesophilobacter sediminis]MBJ6727313.1 B12-binding domain-containing radical SAM protein [Geomesophilobacter sediminis]